MCTFRYYYGGGFISNKNVPPDLMNVFYDVYLIGTYETKESTVFASSPLQNSALFTIRYIKNVTTVHSSQTIKLTENIIIGFG